MNSEQMLNVNSGQGDQPIKESRRAYKLIGGQSVILFSETLALMLLMSWYTFSQNSALETSLIQSLPIVVSMVFLPFAGVLADLGSPLKIIRLSTQIVTFCLLGIALVSYFITNRILLSSGLLFLFVVYNIVTTIVSPSFQSMVASTLDRSDTREISRYKTAMQVSGILAKFLSGIFLQFIGVPISMLISAFLVFWGGRILPQSDLRFSQKQFSQKLRFFALFKESLIYLRGSSRLMRYTLFATLLNGCFAVYMLAFPFLFKSIPGVQVAGLGPMMSTLVAGQIVGSLYSSLAQIKKVQFALISVTGILAMLLILVSSSRSVYELGAYVFSLGVTMALFGILSQIILFRLINENQIGRVTSVVSLFAQMLMPLVSVSCGWLVDAGQFSFPSVLKMAGVITLLSIPLIYKVCPSGEEDAPSRAGT